MPSISSRPPPSPRIARPVEPQRSPEQAASSAKAQPGRAAGSTARGTAASSQNAVRDAVASSQNAVRNTATSARSTVRDAVASTQNAARGAAATATAQSTAREAATTAQGTTPQIVSPLKAAQETLAKQQAVRDALAQQQVAAEPTPGLTTRDEFQPAATSASQPSATSQAAAPSKAPVTSQSLQNVVAPGSGYSPGAVSAGLNPDGTRPAGAGGYSPGAVSAGLNPDGTRPAGAGGYSPGAVSAGLNPDGTQPTDSQVYALDGGITEASLKARSSSTTPASTTPASTTPPTAVPANIPFAASTAAGTTPAGTTPAGTTPAGTTPAGTTPAGTTAAGTTPAGTTPAGTTPAGTTPAGTTPAGTTPAGTTPAGTTPAGTTPAAQPAPSTVVVPTKEQREAIVANAKASTTEDEQRQFLASLGIPEKHLNDTYGDKLAHAYGETVDALLQPGDHKRSLKIDNQYDLNVEVDDQLNLKSAQAAQDRDSSFFGKVLDAVAPVASVVGAALGPVTGGISTVVGAAISGFQAVRQGDILGVVSSVAGGIGGFLGQAGKLGGAFTDLVSSQGARTLAAGANFVSRGADLVKGSLEAFRTGNLGGIVSAVADGAGLVSETLGKAGGQLTDFANTVERGARITLNGARAVDAIKLGDYFGAAQNILGAGALATKPLPSVNAAPPAPGSQPTTPSVSDRLAQAADIVGTAKKAKTAFETGDYTNLVAEGLRLAQQVSGNETVGRAADIASPAAELINAINGGDLKGIVKSAKGLYEQAARFEQLGLPENPLDLAKDALRRTTGISL